jgi:sugar lactone lactonase YvrE
MSKSNLRHLVLPLALLCGATALQAAPVTTTILHDTFAASAVNAGLGADANNYRAPTATQAVWYGGGATVTYTPNTSIGLTAGNRGLMAYFTPSTSLASLAVGETLTATVTFKFTGGTGALVANDDFRVAFLNSGGNGTATNNGATPPAAASGARVISDNFSLTAFGDTARAYSGYLINSTAAPVASTNSLSFWRRDGAPGRSQQWLGPTATLVANTAFSQLLPGAGGGTAGAIVNDGTVYVAKLALNLVAANQMALSYSVTSGTTTVMAYALTETSDAPYTGFDTFMILSLYNASLAVTDFLITKTSVTPAIVTQPASQVAAAGTDVTFGVTATGAPAPTYQWRKDGVNLAGATAASLTLTNVQNADAAAYTVVVTNAVGAVTSAPATLTVLTTPEITTQPAGQTIFEGQNATIAVGVRGAPTLTYVWKKGGVTVSNGGVYSGATTAALTLTGAQIGDAGDYTVAITNSYGTATSAVATLAVYPATPPSITTQPASQTVFEGANVSFSAVISGPPPFTYRWYKGAVLLADDGRITGSATGTLTVGSARLSDAGSYTLVVSNFAAAVTSAAAVLTVNAAPTPLAPTALPARNIAETEFTARWTAAANATGYRLDISTDVAFGTLVAGYANLDVGPTLSAGVTGLTVDTNYYYRVRAYNSSGTSASSNIIAVRVQTPVAPVITSASSTVFTVGVAGSFTVTATGAPPPTFSATGLPSWAALNATTGIISGTPPAGTAASQVSVAITATNDKAPDATQSFTLIVRALPTVAEPLTVTTLAGSAGLTGTTDATGAAARFNHLSDVAVDTAGNVYVADTGGHLIRKVTAAGAVTTLAGRAGISGNTDATGTAASFNSPSGIAVDTAGNVYVADTLNHTIRKITAAGVVTTLAGNAGSTGSADGTGAAARFFWPQGLGLDATGANLYVADTNNHTVRKIALASAAVTTFAGLAGQAGSTDATGAAARFRAPYDVAVDKNGTIYVADTDNGTIRAITPAGVVSTLAGLAGSTGAADGSGSTARFSHPYSVGVDGSFSVYVADTDNHTVRKIVSALGVVSTVAGQPGTAGAADGIGAVARFNYPSGLAVTAAGDLYIADTNSSTLRSGGAPSAPVITTQPQSQSATLGGSAVFTVRATGRPAPTYQWSLNGGQIAGATSDTLTVGATAANAGDYTVTVTNALGSVTSNRAGFIVNLPTTTPVGISGGGGAPGLWFYAALAALVAFRWLARRPARLSMSKSTLFGLACAFIMLLPCAAFAQVPVITTQPTPQIATPGATATFTVAATSATSYRWQKNSVDLADAASHISGSGTATLTVSNVVAGDYATYQVVVTNGTGPVTSDPVVLANLTANAGTGIATGGFTASWNSVAGATNYVMDVSTNRSFAAGYFVAGYQALSVGSNLSQAVTGLTENTTYFYRVRVTGFGGNSTLMPVRTLSTAASPTGVIFNETIPNATAATNTDLNVPLTTDTNGYLVPTAVQGAWYLGGSTNVSAYVQNTLFALSAGASRGYLAYFKNSSSVATLAIGDKLTATVRFKLTDGSPNSTAGNLRFALLNSNGNGGTVNVAGGTNDATNGNPARLLPATALSVTANAPARGTSGYIVESTAAPSAPAANSITFWQRLPANFPNDGGTTPAGSTKGTSQWVGPAVASTPGNLPGVYQAYLDAAALNPPVAPIPNFVPVGTAGGTAGAMPSDGSDYVLTLSVKYDSASQVTLAYTLKNGATTIQSHTATQTTGTLVTAFDTVFIYNNTNAIQSILGLTISQASSPAVPVAGAATGLSSSGFTANWAAAANASSYRLDVATDSGFTAFVAGYQDRDVSNTLSATLTGLADATTYYYRVRAVSDAGTSASSSTITASTPVAVPAAPTATAATGITTSGFTANWGAVSGATGYRLDVSTSNTFGTFVAGNQDRDVGNNASAAVTGLADNTQYYYRVRATNAGGASASSNTITATTPATPLSITTQPADQSKIVGDNVTFTVAATSTTTLSYQWQKRPSGGSFADLNGETAASLALTNVQLADSGDSYRVIVTNAAGPVTSSIATLTVTAGAIAAGIGTQPASQVINLGGTATFTVVATGTAPISYQWQKGGVDVANSAGHIAGATTDTLTITGALAADAGSYTVIVSNSVPGSVTSSAATLTVQSPPTANPATLVTTSRFTANWTTVAGATGYRLDVSTDSGFGSFVTGFQDLNLGTVLTRPVVGLAGGTTYYYRVRAVNGSLVSANSNTASVTTLPAPAGITILHDTNSAATVHAGLATDANGFLVPTATQAVWAPFGTANFAYTQNVSLGVSAGATRGIMAYFAPSTALTTLAVGESISATVTFTFNAGTLSETVGNFRLGLLNSNGNGTAINNTGISARYAPAVSNSLTGTPTGNTARAYSGYIVSTKAATTASNDTQSFWFRVPAFTATGGLTEIVGPTATDVVASTTFLALGSATGGAAGAILNNGTTVYVANFTIKYVSASQVDLTYIVKTGATTVMSSSSSQTSGALATSFDSLMIFSTYGAAPAILDLNIARIASIPVIGTQPVSQPAIIGDTVTLTAAATGTAPLTYRWQKDNVDLNDGGRVSGATTATLTLTGVQLADTGAYRVVVTNPGGSTPSAAATVTVNAAAVAPAITGQPQATSVAAGGTANFSVTATGTAPLTYRWRKDGVDLTDNARISGATTAALAISSLQFADAGSYTVAVTNSVTTVVSDPAALTVTVPLPVIVSAPQTQSALTGGRVSLSVFATGTGPFTYQWSKGGVAISGATGQSYSLSGLVAADAGNYTVAITNAGGTTTSAAAVLTLVAPAATLPTQPVIPAGLFRVTDYGAVGDGTTNNATAIQAAISAAQTAGGGTIVIPGATGAYLSGPLTLGSNLNLQIDGGATLRALPYASYPNATTSPAHFITVPSGATNVAITGNGTIEGDGSAWWTAYNSNNNISRPRLIQFTRASNVYIGGIRLQNSPQFHIALSGSGGSPNTNITAFGLTITAPSSSPNTDGFDPTATNCLIQNCSIAVGDDNIAIKAQNGNCGNMTIADCTFGVGHGLSIGGQTNFGLDGLTVLRCTFTGTTSGIRMKADATQGGPVQNVTYTDLTMTNVPYPIVFYSYYNDVGTPGAVSGGNQTTPAKVKLWNATPPDPLNAATIPTWKNITINNLTATGATGYSIIWGLPLASALFDNVTLNNVSITGGPGLEVYNAGNVQYTGTTSFPGLITTNALVITGQPAVQTVNPGDTATFTVAATGASGVNGTAPTYQWKRNGTALLNGALPNGSIVSGATTATLTVTGARLGNAGNFTCTVSNTLDGYNPTTSTLVPDSLPVSATSRAAALTVNAVGSPLSITTQPADQSIASGTTLTLTVAATSGTPLNYQWRKGNVDLVNGGRISGVNTDTLTITATVDADSGDYSVVVLNDAGSTTSAIATVLVQTPPAITTQPAASQSVLEGVTVNFTVVASGTAPLTYQWKKAGANVANDARISGATTATLTISGALIADSGTYTVVVTNPVTSLTSAAAVLTVSPVPTVPPAPVAGAATNVTFSSFAANWAAAATATGYRLDVSANSAFTTFLTGYQNLDVGTNLTRNLTGLTPLTAYYYRVRAVNAVGTGANSATIAVTTAQFTQAPVITSAAVTTFTLNQASTFTFTASGAPAPTFTATGLPAWVTLNSATGLLSGTAPAGTAGAQFPLVVTAQNGTLPNATQNFTLAVLAAPAVTTPMTITTLAGLALTGGSTDATGAAARFNHPLGLAVDSTGNLYVADTDNHTIRRVAPGAIVTTFAGTAGSAGTANGTGAAARFRSPAGVAVDTAGNIYVADTLNHTIRRITSSGAVTTIAGVAGTSGTTDGAGGNARFFGPQGLAFYADAASSNLYVADTNNQLIRKVDLLTNTVSTIAGSAGQAGSLDGSGTAARFNAPSDVAVDRNGNIYVADTENHAIRAVTPAGDVRTLAGLAGAAGAADGTGSSARFKHPSALIVDSAYNVFVVDTDNQTLRKIVSSAGAVTTVAGQLGTTGSADGSGATARFNYPSGLTQAATGEFYIADTANYTLRQGVFPNAPVITTHPQSQSVTAGASVQFFVAATGQPAPTYQWYFNGGAISGATGTTLALTNVQSTNSGRYTAVATNAQGAVTSNEATLTVSVAPAAGGISGGGGGGAPGLWFYLALALLAGARWLFLRRAAQPLRSTLGTMTPPSSLRSSAWLILAPLCVAGLAASLSFAQEPPPPAPPAEPPASEPAAETARTPSIPVEIKPPAETAPADEVVTLSPFEVISDTKGYYSANTMSGTRLNTKIEDLASSITVLTKEQMTDFAMLDINDIFLYTGNTEGTGTYTDVTVDRNGQATDNSQGNPNGANRVRGIAAANISYGNFEMMGRTPIDPLIVDGVEVSRGPNSSVFGLGNPSGTVNQVPISANLTRNKYTTQLRGDSYDGWRATFDFNQVLLKNKLAVRVNGASQHDGFVRKPSGFDTKRLDFMVKYRPFKYTTLTASALRYYGEGNRPNNTTPRDYVSAWVNAGRPAWDPVTQLITLNGITYGANTATTTPAPTGLVAGSTIPIADALFSVTTGSTDSAALQAARNSFSRAGGAFQRSNIFIDQTGITYWTAPTATTGNSPAANATGIRLLGPSSSSIFKSTVPGRFDDQPLFTTTPTVSSQELYDWTRINLSSIDQFADKTDTYLVQLDQIFFNTPRQRLSGMAAIFLEDASRYRNTPASNSGVSGQTGQLFVDVNARNLDGTVNPNFGRPYIGVLEPRATLSPAKWETYRASLAYNLDLTQEKGWRKWFGMHVVSGYVDYKYRINRQYSYRDVMTSETAWSAVGVGGIVPNYAKANQSSITGGPQAGPNIMRGFFRYYVGDNNGSNIDYAPSRYSYGRYPFVWGNTGDWHYDAISLGQLPTTDATGGTANLKQIIKTPGAVVQSHFFNDSIVTTFGARTDYVFSKNGRTPQQLTNNNTVFDYDIIDHWQPDWRSSSGRTSTAGVVFRSFRELPFVSRWSASENGVKSFFGDILRGLSLTYNQSNNFIPAPPAVDLYLNPLPNTTGEGKDYGFWLNLADGKVVIRVNKYENTQFNARDGDANTIAQRVLRHDIDAGQSDGFKLYTQATNWVTALNPTWTPDQVATEVYRQIKLDPVRYAALVDNFRNGTLAATNDITGKGTEIEINYNPTKFWTIAMNANDTRAINTNVSSAIQQYIDERMPLWTTIEDPRPQFASLPPGDPNRLWWTNTTYGGSQTAAANYLSFVDAPYSVIRETLGKSQPAVRRYGFKLSTNLQLAGITDNTFAKKFSIGGAVRWEDKGAIGYYGVQQLPASITKLDANNPIYDPGHYYFDAFIGYKTKFFKKYSMSLRLNVKNIQESGGIKPIRAFPDGTPSAYRIVDPRQFIITTTFDL